VAHSTSQVTWALTGHLLACRVHTKEYVEFVQVTSKDKSKVAHKIGDELSISPGGYDIAGEHSSCWPLHIGM